MIKTYTKDYVTEAQDSLRKLVDSIEGAQALFDTLDTVSETEYKQLHTSFLQPLDLKIDTDLFTQEISVYLWGLHHTPSGEDPLMPRYCIPLVNTTGKIESKDYACQSLQKYYENNPGRPPLLDIDFKTPTPIKDLSSLSCLKVFDSHWARSVILYWEAGASLVPHVDTVIPSIILRLWGSTSKDIIMRYWDGSDMKECDVEPGRLYLIDTTIAHDVWCEKGSGYQFALAFTPSGLNIIKDLII